MLKIRKEKEENCRDSAVWHESWSSNHNCFPLLFILSLCLTENSPWLLSASGSASFHLNCELIGWCGTALHCRWGMTPTSLTSNKNNTAPCSPLYNHHKRHHFCHATHFSLLCTTRVVLHTHYRSLSRVCSQLDLVWDACLHSSVRQMPITIKTDQNKWQKLGWSLHKEAKVHWRIFSICFSSFLSAIHNYPESSLTGKRYQPQHDKLQAAALKCAT